jgi:hypothetical protein
VNAGTTWQIIWTTYGRLFFDDPRGKVEVWPEKRGVEVGVVVNGVLVSGLFNNSQHATLAALVHDKISQCPNYVAVVTKMVLPDLSATRVYGKK